MNISKKDLSGFAGYVKPLRLLERTLQSAGIPVVFEARNWPVHGKTVYISYPSVPKHKVICIDGVSVCQAVEEVSSLVFNLIKEVKNG